MARPPTCGRTPRCAASISESAGETPIVVGGPDPAPHTPHRSDAPRRSRGAPRGCHTVSGALLEVRDIHTAYGLSRVLFGVSIEINSGECVCLLGRNGVGKSATMRPIMRLT